MILEVVESGSREAARQQFSLHYIQLPESCSEKNTMDRFTRIHLQRPGCTGIAGIPDPAAETELSGVFSALHARLQAKGKNASLRCFSLSAPYNHTMINMSKHRHSPDSRKDRYSALRGEKLFRKAGSA